MILPKKTQRPPQKDLIQHTFDKYGKDIDFANGLVPSSVGDDSRLPQPGRGYNFDGVDDLLRFNDLTGTTITSFEGTTTPTINGNDIEFTAGILFELTLSDGTFLKCEDTGLLAFDSSGNGNNGTKINTDVLGVNTFSYEGSDVPTSFQNNEGYSNGDASNNNGLFIPKDDSTANLDVLGNVLDFVGPVSYPTQLVESNCIEFDGVDDVIAFSDLTGISIVSNGGTSSLSINGNNIEGTAGNAYNIVLSDGTFLPCAEGVGTTVYDASANGNNGTLVNGVSWTFQDEYHYNLENGFKVIPYNNGTTDQVFPEASNLIADGSKYETEITLLLYPEGNIDTGINLFGTATTTRFTIDTIRCSIRIGNNFNNANQANLLFINPLQYGNTYKIKFVREGINTAVYIDGVFQDTQDLAGANNPNATIPILGDRRIQAGGDTYAPHGYLIEQVDYYIDNVLQHSLTSNENGLIVNKNTGEESSTENRHNGGNVTEAFNRLPLNYVINPLAPTNLNRIIEYKPSQRNHNGAETKVNFNFYNAPALDGQPSSQAINDVWRNQTTKFKRDNSDILLYSQTQSSNKLDRALNYTKE